MFFMRHGQSEFNAMMDQGIDPRTPDPVLTSHGKKQVEHGIKKLTRPINLILTSPFTRAIETAHIVAEACKVQIMVEPLVAEHRLYSCDVGAPRSKLERDWPHLDFSKVDCGEWWLPFPEPRTSLKQRVHAFKQNWGYHDQVDSILVVSHWYFINAVTGAYPDNAEVIEERI